MSSQKTWFVYLIECADGSLYTGITVDLESRLMAHQQGRGARYMRLNPALRIVAAEAHPDRSSASKAEYRIKQMTPTAKRLHAAKMTLHPDSSAAR